MVRKTEKEKVQATESKGPQFAVQRLYIKDLSVEVPHSPEIFLDDWEPKMHMDLNTDSHQLSDEVYEVVLGITVEVKLKHDKVAFLIELKQAGIFSIIGFAAEQMPPMLGAYCPNIIYPYAREVISDAVIRAGFPHLYLAPVNFDALFHQQEQKKHEKEGEGVNGTSSVQ